MNTLQKKYPLAGKAFSLVEVLAAVAIIGIITFLAIPNILRIKDDSERSLAESRVEGLNLAMASLVQARGRTAAATAWAAASTDQDRYDLLRPYLSFAPATIADYMVGGFSATFPSTLTTPLTPVTLTE
jgi:prepilin-type N-terminal cleavage/methylation domain-containing protein